MIPDTHVSQALVANDFDSDALLGGNDLSDMFNQDEELMAQLEEKMMEEDLAAQKCDKASDSRQEEIIRAEYVKQVGLSKLRLTNGLEGKNP
jgi:hypothetical protein